MIEGEKREVDASLNELKREKNSLVAKIELSKKEISKVRSVITSENLKLEALNDDLEMLQNDLKIQKERHLRIINESEKLEKRVKAYQDERDANLEHLFKAVTRLVTSGDRGDVGNREAKCDVRNL